MSDPVGTGKRIEMPAEICPPMSIDELMRLPEDSPIWDTVLPDWVTQAHLRHLETGEGDPWGGYFGSAPAISEPTRR